MWQLRSFDFDSSKPTMLPLQRSSSSFRFSFDNHVSRDVVARRLGFTTSTVQYIVRLVSIAFSRKYVL